MKLMIKVVGVMYKGRISGRLVVSEFYRRIIMSGSPRTSSHVDVFRIILTSKCFE